jgi:hypothetical protein
MPEDSMHTVRIYQLTAPAGAAGEERRHQQSPADAADRQRGEVLVHGLGVSREEQGAEGGV